LPPGVILELKCTKFDFSWNSALDPNGGAYSTPPYLLTGWQGFYFHRKRGEMREGGKGMRRGVREGRKGREEGESYHTGICFPHFESYVYA